MTTDNASKKNTTTDDGRATFITDASTGTRVIESIVLRGDLSGLGPTESAKFYTQMCEGLGLNPHAQPFAFLRLNGKEILYATRGATDQLAAIHKLNREIIDGPKVIDLAGTKLVYAVCRATHPNGRVETATATVPLVDPVNVLMKCETKAKRRATLSICGLGLLDETEVETIPGAVPLAPETAGEASPTSQPRQQRRSNVVVNPATGMKKDLENARNQRPEWDRFTDKVQGFVEARDADGLKLWFCSDDIAEYVAGWVFNEQAHEHFESALDVIAKAERQ